MDPDPDPYQNVMEPQHCIHVMLALRSGVLPGGLHSNDELCAGSRTRTAGQGQEEQQEGQQRGGG